MELSTLMLIIFGLLTIISIICTILLYPGLKDLIDELNSDSKEHLLNHTNSRFDIKN